jgi:hypothetical protein
MWGGGVGLCIEVRTESGNQVGFVADEKNLLQTLLGNPDQPAFPMLASIDPYGDTVFNRMQINRFMTEWKTLFSRASTPEEESLLDAVIELAEKSKQDVHLYLVFIGD